MRRLLPALVTVLLLTGCSGSSSEGAAPGDEGDRGGAASSSGAPTPKSPTGPDCDDVWKAGKTLPADYDGCVTNGSAGEEEIVKCTDGTRFVAYLDTFYARTGDTIVEPEVAPMQDTDEFSAAYTACTGE